MEYARERFLEDGFSAVSMDDIADGLAMSKKTFYRHFLSKDDLLRQIADRMMAEARLAISRIFLSDISSLEKIDRFSVLLGQQGARISKVFMRDVQRLAPDLWQRIRQFREERIQQAFTRVYDQGVREGTFRPEVNRRVFLLAYLAAIDSVITPAVLVEESFSFREALRGVLVIFFRGVLTEEGRYRLQDLEKTRAS
jgi:AcrR family transcriptional regulator